MWDEQAPAGDKISLEAFQKLGQEIWEQKQELERIEAEAKAQSNIVESLKQKALAYMEEANMDNFQVKGFGTIFKTSRFSVTVPKDGEARDMFFGYLKTKGIFEDLITVNSQTLNAFYAREMEAAVEAGNVDFKVPGIGEPKHMVTLGMRKAASK